MAELLKDKNCAHQHDDEPNCQPAFVNHYRCVCGHYWSDTWSCQCDDKCPRCNTAMTPFESVEIADCACKELGK